MTAVRWRPPELAAERVSLELPGGRALEAWSAALRLVTGGSGWPAERVGQLDTVWMLARLTRHLAAEAGGLWPAGGLDALGRLVDLVGRSPNLVEVLAPFLTPTDRRLIAEDLADAAGDLACLAMRTPVWLASSEAARLMLEVQPPGKQVLVSRETFRRFSWRPLSLFPPKGDAS